MRPPKPSADRLRRLALIAILAWITLSAQAWTAAMHTPMMGPMAGPHPTMVAVAEVPTHRPAHASGPHPADLHPTLQPTATLPGALLHAHAHPAAADPSEPDHARSAHPSHAGCPGGSMGCAAVCSVALPPAAPALPAGLLARAAPRGSEPLRAPSPAPSPPWRPPQA